MKLDKTNSTNYVSDIKQIILDARKHVSSVVNSTMVKSYWFIGKRIVEEEQNGENRAKYGKEIIKTLSKELTEEFGRGFSITNIKYFRQFYFTFPLNIDKKTIGHSTSDQLENQKHHLFSDKLGNLISHLSSDQLETDENIEILQLIFTKLNWTHIRQILRVKNTDARNYYIKETAKNSWVVETLDRNIATQYYERLLLSQNKQPVKDEMDAKTKHFEADKLEFVKSPSVLEFLNIPTNRAYTEQELEKAIIDNIQAFLLEMGKGYAFVERQKLIRTEVRDYYIDLVFYNYILKCFVLIDLKTNRITHQDVGQMDMYVRMFDEKEKTADDNPTLGIVLCSETDTDIARYSILKGNEHIFASKYKLYLPSEEELKAEIEREKLNFKLQMGLKDE